MTSIATTVTGVFTGIPETRWEDRPPSAIRKHAVDGQVKVTRFGLDGDKQADLTVHGGPDKALHFYPADHYSHWAAKCPDSDFRFEPGAFGENISAAGLDETQVHLGDIFQIGTARVQISQGRQPCWKLNMHSGIPSLAAKFQRSLKTGWYFRVLEEGTVEPGSSFSLLDRPCPDWPLSSVIAARFDPKLDPGIAALLARLPQLAENWRASFAKKSDPGYEEDTSGRLG